MLAYPAKSVQTELHDCIKHRGLGYGAAGPGRQLSNNFVAVVPRRRRSPWRKIVWRFCGVLDSEDGIIGPEA
jgi:hypothetical protein